MSQRSPIFWTDAVQAQERLASTVVLYGQYPFYVTGVQPMGADVIAVGTKYTEDGGKNANIKLSDPEFHRFRKLPPLGWSNSVANKTGVYFERFPVRSRMHGLSHHNVRARLVATNGDIYNSDERYGQLATDPGYIETCLGKLPELREVTQVIRPGTSIAISSKYAVFRDITGLRWLYRETEKIGMFVGADTLMLLENKSYLREELQTDPVITTSNIREF